MVIPVYYYEHGMKPSWLDVVVASGDECQSIGHCVEAYISRAESVDLPSDIFVCFHGMHMCCDTDELLEQSKWFIPSIQLSMGGCGHQSMVWVV
jgi:hypothetical protein